MGASVSKDSKEVQRFLSYLENNTENMLAYLENSVDCCFILALRACLNQGVERLPGQEPRIDFLVRPFWISHLPKQPYIHGLACCLSPSLLRGSFLVSNNRCLSCVAVRIYTRWGIDWTPRSIYHAYILPLYFEL